MGVVVLEVRYLDAVAGDADDLVLAGDDVALRGEIDVFALQEEGLYLAALAVLRGAEELEVDRRRRRWW